MWMLPSSFAAKALESEMTGKHSDQLITKKIKICKLYKAEVRGSFTFLSSDT